MVDWVFLRFIDILNKKIKRVVYRTPLRDPDNPRKRILGVWMRADFIRQFGKDTIVYEGGTLYIDPNHNQHKTGDEYTLSTFIHELCHILLSDVLHERSVARIEKLLFELFSPEQKKALARFLPKQNEAS